MVGKYVLVFDEIMLKQLQKLGKDENIRWFLSKIFDKLEELGPQTGKCIDSHLLLYEVKMKRPPIRLYFKHVRNSNELYVFEYEMKTSIKKQQQTIHRIRKKTLEP
jgi:hypothetical protein